MLTISQLKDNTQRVIAGLKKKNFVDAEKLVSHILSLDEKRRAIQHERDALQAEINTVSVEVGVLMKQNRIYDANTIKSIVPINKLKIKGLESTIRELEEQQNQALVLLPNLPADVVPVGRTAEDNEVVFTHGEKTVLADGAKAHWDLIKGYDIIDFELGNKITGAGFPVYKGKGARLQRALINYFLDEAEKAGYREVQIPILVNKNSVFCTGQLPDKEEQMYHVTEDELYLIPTAEVPITNIFNDVILKENELPQKLVGYTPCFRREAGSWGTHVRGLNRLHQFDKVEIVQIVDPNKSYDALEEMRVHVEELLQKLQLHYRVLRLCGGDMSFSSALTYDMEVWSAAQERWLEVSSVSNFETFQANRLKLRFKRETEKKTILCHTLNGSALALPRIVAAILENNQTPEGIRIPEVLVPYTGFSIIN